ncbi:hypothetical protein BZA05DRAFT_48085 [Tricharina praecox]|uniref:uncharacterized protein n=1 Tax=Tricharina praecox TaxID=43433 RepID=UPI00221E8B40|nr:uncharacterized protein BZA05DRAFT_48085 [Tricharina praecox]KAI5851950.1 hypothetical protein BZA05DRAFT_48085 [Tricharina praecox]
MFFFLKPKYSFGALLISLEIQRKLLTALNVFPAFLDILHLFGDKCDEMNEDYAVYQQEITWERDKYMNATKTPEAFEICYNFRYIDQAVKGQGESFTWRRKKMGFYSKYVPATKTSTWISVLAPRECVPRLKDVFTSDPMHPRERRHDLDIHILFMQIATRSWLPYINALDDDLRKMDKRAFLWRPKPGNLILKAHKDSELELVDTQRVQKFKIELLTMIHALEVNQANIASLRRGIESFRRKTNVYITDDQYKQYDEDLEDLHILLSQHKVRVSNLLQRAESLFALIITIIPYNYARHENTLMLQLSEKAAVYAKSMKVITVVCMLYLPPSVVASIFGMGFSDPTWSTSVTWIVFTAITIGLAMLSILVWLWWEKKCAKE